MSYKYIKHVVYFSAESVSNRILSESMMWMVPKYYFQLYLPPSHNDFDDIIYELPPRCITLLSLPTSLRTAIIC